VSDARAARGLGARTCQVLTLGGMAVLLLAFQPLSAECQRAPEVGSLRGQKFARLTRGVLAYELVPSFTGSFKGASFRTNRWGMRDKEYELKPPPRTYRIALLGSSFTMAAGVPDEETHEWVLEDRLNRDGPGAPRRHYEILNFAVAGYGILQQVAVVDRKVFPFAPNAVLLTLHVLEQDRIMTHISRLLHEGAQIEYPELRQMLQEAGLRPGMQQPEERRLLARVAPDIMRWSLEHIARVCREHGVTVVGILFAEPREPRKEERRPELAAAALRAGIPLIDLKGVYDGHNFDSVHLPVGDPHLNALGHRLVADRIYQVLRENDARMLKLGFSAPR
jgi:hypothetical protein